MTLAICIPVRDEEARLPALLSALEHQIGVMPATMRLCFFLDGCTDRSEALVRAYAERSAHAVRVEAGPVSAPNAGRARRAAMALGLLALDGVAGAMLLTTDADCVPEPDWVLRSRAALALADIVAGRIVRLPGAPSAMQDRVEAYYDRLHALRRRIDPVAWEDAPAHHFTGGANLGFRIAAYRALGGFIPLAAGEDARIVDDAGRLGLRVRRDRASVVRTSPRRTGRTAGGLAAALRALDVADAAPQLAHPDDAAWQYRMQARARAAFDKPERIAAALGLTADHAIGVARDCPNAEAFAMRIVPAPPDMRMVTLGEAEAALRAIEGADLVQVA